MEDSSQVFGGAWWSSGEDQQGDSQGSIFTDIGPLSNSILQTVNQNDALDPHAYYLESGMHCGDVRTNDHSFLANPLNPNVQTLPSGFHTAPSTSDPPSQTHQLRGYYTDPQAHEVQPMRSAGLSDMALNQAGDIDLEHFMQPAASYHAQMSLDPIDVIRPDLYREEEVQDLPGGLSNDAATSLIRSYVELYPTTFFYKEKVEALAALTALPSQAVENVISEVLGDVLHVPTQLTSSSRFSKSSVTTSQSQPTTNYTVSPSTTAQSQSSRITGNQQSHAHFKRPKNISSLQPRESTHPVEPGSRHKQIHHLPVNFQESPILRQAAEYLLRGRADKCRQTFNKALLSRDEEKIFQCTFKCGARFYRKADLRRHEEEKNYPQEGWVCDVDPIVIVGGISTCAYCRLQNPSRSHTPDEHQNRRTFCHEKEFDARGKIFTRKKRLIEHYKNFHPALPVAEYLNACHFVVQSKIPKWCGFCEVYHDFSGSKVRNDHMASHFVGGLDMSKWRDPLGSSMSMDEDGDTDGDGDENGNASDEDMDEDDDSEITGHNSQPGGGSSSGAHFQNNRSVNSSFSTLGTSVSGQVCFKRDTAGLQNHKTYWSLPFGNIHRNITSSTHLGKIHKPKFLIASNDALSLSRQRSQEKQGSERPQMLGTRIKGSTLEQNIWNARVPYSLHRFFIPITDLQCLITLENVCYELQVYYPESPEIITIDAETIVNNAQRLFAILVYIGKGSAIRGFLAEDITDKDLPIRKTRYDDLRAFALWNPKTVEAFDRDQWSFMPPVFDTIIQHYELEESVILPFIQIGDSNKTMEGGYSEVSCFRIHPSHHNFWESSLDSEPLVAVKRLHSADEIEFEKEATILRQLGTKDHPHIIKLLATYRLGHRFHFVFPFARGNLRSYWHNVPLPRWNRETCLWSLRQMQGIASGLQTIHNFGMQAPNGISSGSVPDTSISTSKRTERFGRHGDIKPENILWFKSGEGYCDDRNGILQISDFGLGRFHGRDSRSNVDPRTVVSTPTYEPPEIALSKPVSRAYDIWSFACVMLEFITWLLGGSESLEAFQEARSIEQDCVWNDQFFTVKEDPGGQANAFVQDAVLLWIERLHSHERCSELIHDLLDLTKNKLLVVNTKYRIPATRLQTELQQLVKRAEADESYLLSPAPYDNTTLKNTWSKAGAASPLPLECIESTDLVVSSLGTTARTAASPSPKMIHRNSSCLRSKKIRT